MKKYCIIKNGLNEYIPGIIDENKEMDSFWTWVTNYLHTREDALVELKNYKISQEATERRRKKEIIYLED